MVAVILVSGAPGAGKSTLAGPLSTVLGLPLLSKDVIKEVLADSLPAQATDTLSWSRVLGQTAMELLWALAKQLATVILEANVRPGSELERRRLLELGRPVIEIHCICPPGLAIERFQRRARTTLRHPVAHPMTSVAPAMLAEFDGPMGLGEVITVDTARPVDVGGLADRVSCLMRFEESRNPGDDPFIEVPPPFEALSTSPQVSHAPRSLPLTDTGQQDLPLVISEAQ